MRSRYVVCLTVTQRSELEAITRRACAEHRQVLRARIVLDTADGASNAAIGRRFAIDADTAGKWRRRFCLSGIEGLLDLPRSGRPRKFTAEVVAGVKALACELPTTAGVAMTRWSCPELAREVVTRGVVEQVSVSTVRRWLAADAIKPWQHRSWIFPRDPYFASKAARVLDLYARTFDGEPLGDSDFVLSADEKPGVQARHRKHPSLEPAAHRPMRVEAEYTRNGTLAYFAAYDVHRAHVIGRCEPTTGIVPFTRLVDQVMSSEPLRQRPAGVLGRRQRRLPPQLGRGATAQRRLPQRAHGPPARARVLAEPGRDLLLRRATQSTYPRQLHRPQRRGTTAGGLPEPLQPHRQPLRLDLHPHRPQQPTHTARQPRPPYATTPCRVTTDELTGAPTRKL